MKVTPRTEEETAMAGLLEAGTYDAEVIKAQETTSKAGNEMLALDLRIFGKNGAGDRIVYDYLLDTESMAFKLRHFCDSAGILHLYEAGAVEADKLIGKTVKAVIEVRKQKDFPPKNAVKDYLTHAQIENGGKAAKDAEPDDDLPF